MREYIIESEQDFDSMIMTFKKHFRREKGLGNKFKKLRIIAKRYVPSRTPKQLRTYWICIRELKIAFKRVGYILNESDIHELVKREAGYTELLELPSGRIEVINKSIAEKAEGASIDAVNHLIEFIIQYAAQNLDYQIVIEGEINE
jgi:hypothetical protein